MTAATALARLGETFRTFALTPFRPTALSLRDPNLSAILNDPPASGTASVTEASALRFPPVWAAVQTIAGDVASLPFFHYRRLPDGGKERLTDSKLYKVLHDEFNPEMTDMVGRETLTAHVLLWGNGYAEIVRNDLGQVVALFPIEPNRVMPERDESGAIVYRVQAGDGTEVRIPAARILHLVGLGFNGLMGYSVIGMMRNALAVGMGAESLGNAVMNSGGKYVGFLEHPRVLGDKARKHILDSIAADRPGGYRILEEGMTFKPGSMSMEDAQFLETRQFSVTEVARIFGIPPHKLGDLSHATFSNIEEQNIDYVLWTLRRWLVRWEKECNRKLIAPLEKRQQFCEHLIDGALRGSIATRYAAYQIGRNNGWLSANMILEKENENPIPGGDVVLVQGAMVPLARLNEIIDAQVRPPPAPAPANPPPAEDTGAADDEATDDTARIVTKLVEDLRAEITGPPAWLEGFPAAVVAALPPPPPPAVAEPPPAVAEERPAPLTAEALAGQLEPVRSAITAAQDATIAALGARLATEADLRGWREATFALVAGKLVRREVAQLRKRETGDAATAPARIDAFYRRFVGDGLAELRPWLLRLPEPEAREMAATRVLQDWADAAVATCTAALANGGLGEVVRRWEIDRAAGLTTALMEALDGRGS
jgi:HK97 family phage portal protein